MNAPILPTTHFHIQVTTPAMVAQCVTLLESRGYEKDDDYVTLEKLSRSPTIWVFPCGTQWDKRRPSKGYGTGGTASPSDTSYTPEEFLSLFTPQTTAPVEITTKTRSSEMNMQSLKTVLTVIDRNNWEVREVLESIKIHETLMAALDSTVQSSTSEHAPENEDMPLPGDCDYRGSQVEPLQQPAPAYRPLTVDDVIIQGDEWILRPEFHSRRPKEWRKVDDSVGNGIEDYPKSNFRRPL